MSNLKTILNKSHRSKTKAELINLLSNISALITPEEYAKVSGIQPSELPKNTKAEIQKILQSFKSNYKSTWEKNVLKAPEKVVKAIFNQMKADENSFSTSNAANANFAAELGSIDFEKLIGGPLNAAVTAQANASLSTVNFIKEVGFDDDGEIKMVDFSYKKTNEDNTTEDVVIKVPFVSVLNIPSLRIEVVDIDFNVKLNSVYSRDVNSQFGIDASASGGWGPVKFKVSASYKRSSSTGIKVEKQYTMGVKVRATNDEMPAGLEKVLGLLSE